MPSVSRTVTTKTPIAEVWTYLSDFATTEQWDPGTVRCHRLSGGGGKGTEYENVSSFRGNETTLKYVVQTYEEQRHFTLRGENKSVISVDDMTFRSEAGGTTVVYSADFTFKGLAKLATPFLGGALNKLADDAQAGMQKALDGLTA